MTKLKQSSKDTRRDQTISVRDWKEFGFGMGWPKSTLVVVAIYTSCTTAWFGTGDRPLLYVRYFCRRRSKLIWYPFTRL